MDTWPVPDRSTQTKPKSSLTHDEHTDDEARRIRHQPTARLDPRDVERIHGNLPVISRILHEHHRQSAVRPPALCTKAKICASRDVINRCDTALIPRTREITEINIETVVTAEKLRNKNCVLSRASYNGIPPHPETDSSTFAPLLTRTCICL